MRTYREAILYAKREKMREIGAFVVCYASTILMIVFLVDMMARGML